VKKQKNIRLKPKERKNLQELLRKGKEKARKLTRCRILLLSDESRTNSEITKVLHIALNTVRQVCRRYINEGLEGAINERQRSGAPKKFTGSQKAQITALACSKAPDGRSKWTLRLLADKIVELNISSDISRMSVDRILKKTN
jgi:transposase